MEELPRILQHSLSHDAEERKAGEALLADAKDKPGHAQKNNFRANNKCI